MTTAKTVRQFGEDWPAVEREDGCRVEIVCPHGIGHPVRCLSRNWQPWMSVHGCDGCCASAAFAIAERIHSEGWV